MYPPDCPAWEYDQHPRRAEVLKRTTAETLGALAVGSLDTAAVAVDTRIIHRHLFSELIPPGYDYYAGHYRGENYRCLLYYRVHVPGDPHVAYEPSSVWLGMREAARVIRDGLAVLDANRDIPDVLIPRPQKVLQVVVFACRVFEFFLRVHPYTNGNGHVARLLVWCLLGRYGYWPRSWPVEPKPSDPPYTQLIVAYRNGNREPLEEFVLKTIA